MRGLLFNYLLEYLEEIADYSLVDQIIESLNIPNQGSFADGGLYNDTDLMRMLSKFVSYFYSELSYHVNLQMYSKRDF